MAVLMISCVASSFPYKLAIVSAYCSTVLFLGIGPFINPATIKKTSSIPAPAESCNNAGFRSKSFN